MDGNIAISIDQTPAQKKAAELNHQGVQAYLAGQGDAAYFNYLAALLLDPDNKLAWMNLGVVLNNVQRSVAAEVVGRRVLAMLPDFVGGRLNVMAALAGQRRFREAETMCLEGLALTPEDPSFLHNLALIHYGQGHFVEAFRLLEQAVKVRPDGVDIRNDRALAKLALGDLGPALKDYDVRWEKLGKNLVWELGVPEWQGEGLIGKRILLHHEQGYGDSIMLCRLVKEVAAKGGAITLVVPEPLLRLFRHNFGYFAHVCDFDNLPKEHYDFHSPLLSTLRYLGYERTDQIQADPYLVPAKTYRWKAKADKLNIGICWASGDHGFAMKRRRRVVELDQLLPLAISPKVQLISLQKDKAANDIEHCFAQSLVTDPMGLVEDFSDTADIIAQLDLVVTVDTAVAHLSGALGVPTIVLSPVPRCWRWWGVDTGLPWYMDMALCYQDINGSWDDAAQEAQGLAYKWLGLC